MDFAAQEYGKGWVRTFLNFRGLKYFHGNPLFFPEKRRFYTTE
jgi:hypothetical protein